MSDLIGFLVRAEWSLEVNANRDTPQSSISLWYRDEASAWTCFGALRSAANIVRVTLYDTETKQMICEVVNYKGWTITDDDV